MASYNRKDKMTIQGAMEYIIATSIVLIVVISILAYYMSSAHNAKVGTFDEILTAQASSSNTLILKLSTPLPSGAQIKTINLAGVPPGTSLSFSLESRTPVYANGYPEYTFTVNGLTNPLSYYNISNLIYEENGKTIAVSPISGSPMAIEPSSIFSSGSPTSPSSPTPSPLTVSLTETNTIIDAGQISNLYATAQGGTPPYTYVWYNATTSTPQVVSGATVSNLVVQGKTTGYFEYFVSVTDSNSVTADSSNIALTVNPLLVANSITPSNVVINSGQSVTLTANALGGTLPYSYQWYSGASSNCLTDTAISGATSNSIKEFPTSTTYYCYEVTDSATTPSNAISPSDLVTVNSITPSALSISLSPTSNTLDANQMLSLTSTVNGGTPPFTIDYTSSNTACGSLSVASNTLSADGSNTIVFTANSVTSECSTTITANVMDSESPPATNTVTSMLTINPALTAGAITPSNPTINSGQSITLTANPSGGTTPYTYQWYSGSSSSTCTTQISGTTNTITVTPSSSTYYCYQVKDSASSPETVMSASDLVTVSSSSPSPQSVIYSVPITITNTQGTATPAPFQQMISVDSGNYMQYEQSGLQNVEFTTLEFAKGNVLDAWIESGASNTASNTIYWVKLPNGIGADSSITIYMNFMPNSVMSSSGPTGEAPQLSPTYAEYDDGASVFNVYLNFEGTSLPSGWNSGASPDGTVSINNGLTLGTSTSYDPSYSYIVSTTPYSPQIVDFDLSNIPISPWGVGGVSTDWGFSTTSSPTAEPGGPPQLSYEQLIGGDIFSAGGYYRYELVNNVNNNNIYNTNIVASQSAGFNPGLYGTYTNPLIFYYNYGTELTSSSSVSSNNYILLGIDSAGGGAGSPASEQIIVNWLRTRAYPPNGYMPTFSFSSVQSS